MTSHLQRVAEAEAMFKQIIRDALGSIVEPSRDRTRPLLQYADVLNWEMVSQWMDEENPYDNTKEIIFIKLNRIHHILKGIFDFEVLMQFHNREDISQRPNSVVVSLAGPTSLLLHRINNPVHLSYHGTIRIQR